MDKLIINGGKKLRGEITIFGSKNVALKVLVAACLTEEEVVVNNVPLISDFITMLEIIREMGGEATLHDHSVTIRMKKINNKKISLDKAAEVRTSYMFLAPLLARTKMAIIPNPGGCRIGARPIDRVIDGLKRMGVMINYESEDGYFHAACNDGLKAVSYNFSKNTHTGTETMILAAVLAKGETILTNAAEEPEVDELINFLNKMGAKIKRIEPRTIVINGVDKLHGTSFEIGADRNEIVTFAVAALITEGDILIKNIKKNGLTEFLNELDRIGAGYEEKTNGIRFYYKQPLKPTDVTTCFYPGFMTDWQGPWAVLMTKAKGQSVIHEAVYENRFSYVSELNKMGAKIELFNPVIENAEDFYNFNINDDKKGYFHAAKIFGPAQLHNAIVEVYDLRAGATLVLAALTAQGESVIFGIEHLDRGYEKFEERLGKLGASIKRVNETI